MTEHRAKLRIGLVRVVLLVSAGLLFVAVSAESAASPVACDDDEHCPSGSVCEEQRCVIEERESDESQREAARHGADAECGYDRRCRIERLAQKNRARRYQRAFEDEQAVQEVIDRREQKRQEELIRLDSPWLIAMLTSPEYGAGFMGGYAPTARVRIEANWRWRQDNVFEEVDGTTVDGLHNYNLYTLGAAYFFGTSEFVPYVRAAVGYAHGGFDRWDSGDGGSGSRATQWHLGTVGAGVDLQFDLGLYFRLGGSFSHLIFNQARIDRGEYDDTLRDAVGEDFFPLDFEFAFGWAF